jgi:hypothetical protein
LWDCGIMLLCGCAVMWLCETAGVREFGSWGVRGCWGSGVQHGRMGESDGVRVWECEGVGDRVATGACGLGRARMLACGGAGELGSWGNARECWGWWRERCHAASLEADLEDQSLVPQDGPPESHTGMPGRTPPAVRDPLPIDTTRTHTRATRTGACTRTHTRTHADSRLQGR